MSQIIRVLGLGNDLLADDAFGVEIVHELRARLPGEVETATSIASGFALLDDVAGADRLIVVDTIAGGRTPGTVHRFDEATVGAPHAVPLQTGDGASPHYVGLFEALRLGRELGLRMPAEVVILAVEAADCLTVGGEMCADVRAAAPAVVTMVVEIVAGWSSTGFEPCATAF